MRLHASMCVCRLHERPLSLCRVSAGFMKDLSEIVQITTDRNRSNSRRLQTMLVSATLSTEIAALAGLALKDPLTVTASTSDTKLKGNATAQVPTHQYILLSHCVSLPLSLWLTTSLTVSPCLSHCGSLWLTLTVSPCLSHCGSLPLSLCLTVAHYLSHCVSLSLCLTVSHCHCVSLPLSLWLTVSHCTVNLPLSLAFVSHCVSLCLTCCVIQDGQVMGVARQLQLQFIPVGAKQRLVVLVTSP